MYQTLISSLVVVAALTVLHLVVRRLRAWHRERSDRRAAEVAAWIAAENSQFHAEEPPATYPPR